MFYFVILLNIQKGLSLVITVSRTGQPICGRSKNDIMSGPGWDKTYGKLEIAATALTNWHNLILHIHKLYFSLARQL